MNTPFSPDDLVVGSSVAIAALVFFAILKHKLTDFNLLLTALVVKLGACFAYNAIHH